MYMKFDMAFILFYTVQIQSFKYIWPSLQSRYVCYFIKTSYLNWLFHYYMFSDIEKVGYAEMWLSKVSVC